MLCNVKLSNSSLASVKLREHFTKVHGTGKYKDTTLNQSCCNAIGQDYMLGKEVENKLSLVPPSNDVVKSQINEIGENILSQVVADSRASPTKFSIQFDETTDVANLNQLIAFVRYVKGQEIKKIFCFANNL